MLFWDRDVVGELGAWGNGGHERVGERRKGGFRFLLCSMWEGRDSMREGGVRYEGPGVRTRLARGTVWVLGLSFQDNKPI